MFVYIYLSISTILTYMYIFASGEMYQKVNIVDMEIHVEQFRMKLPQNSHGIVYFFTQNYEIWNELNDHIMINHSVQLLSRVQLFVTPWTAACQPPCPSPTPHSLLKLMSIESVMLSNHLILCCPLLLCLQSFPASGSFPMSQLFSSHDQSTGASAEVLLMNIQG